MSLVMMCTGLKYRLTLSTSPMGYVTQSTVRYPDGANADRDLALAVNRSFSCDGVSSRKMSERS